MVIEAKVADFDITLKLPQFHSHVNVNFGIVVHTSLHGGDSSFLL